MKAGYTPTPAHYKPLIRLTAAREALLLRIKAEYPNPCHVPLKDKGVVSLGWLIKHGLVQWSHGRHYVWTGKEWEGAPKSPCAKPTKAEAND